MAKAAKDDGSKPFIKAHGDGHICFADNLAQTENALNRKVEDGEESKLNEGHLLMFGVEEWTSTGIKRVTQAMEKDLNTFKRIEVFGCELDDGAFQEFATGFTEKALHGVERLDIDNTKIEAGAAKILFNNISRGRVNYLNLQGSIPGSATLAALDEALVEGESELLAYLETLDLKLNQLDPQSASEIAKMMLKFNPKGDEFKLDLFYNELGSDGGAHIGRALGEGCNIVELDLCCNKIKDQGALSIANGLRANERLKVLKLALNEITSVGGMAIMKAIIPSNNATKPINKTLEVLDLSANIMVEKEPKENDLDFTTKAQLNNQLIAFDDELTLIEDRLNHNLGPDATEQEKHDAKVALGDLYEIVAGKSEKEIIQYRSGREKERSKVSELLKTDTPLVGAIVALISRESALIDFDFTGVELDKVGWDSIGFALSNTIKPQLDRRHATFRFSIVDLMNQRNLKIMEEYIWIDDKDKDFTHVDWRRPKQPTEETKAEEKTE